MRTVKVLAALAAAGLLVAGCGGSDDGAGAPITSASPTASPITVTSSAFGNNGTLPVDYTCKGSGKAPALDWKGVPAGTQSVALVVFDPDAGSSGFVHWVLYGLPGKDGSILDAKAPTGAKEADNGAGKPGWTPPCPPSGTHHYRFTVYALSNTPNAQDTQSILAQIKQETVAQGEIVGLVASS